MSIEKYLQQEGMTAAELGRQLDVSRSTAHRIKTGHLFKRIRPIFRKIYDVTGITPNQILDIHEK